MHHATSQSPRRRARVVAGTAVCGLLLLGASGAGPAIGETPDSHIDRLARLAMALERKLPDPQLRVLSSGGQQLIQIGRHAETLKGQVQQLREAAPQSPLARPRPHVGQVNDPYAPEDLASRLTGSTQSEATAAWCGRTALAGFNDSGSFIASLFFAASPSGSLSFNGWARSTDAGASFTDQGALVADPLPDGVQFRDLLGDPLLSCTGRQTFYYGSLAIDTNAGGSGDSGISVSVSTDGGQTFGPAVMAAEKSTDTHFLDKPWMDAEPGPTASPGDDVVHVTYTDFDFSSTSTACGEDLRTAIEYVRSTDGGVTWSAPLVLDEVCGEPFVQGSQVESGPGDSVFVAWERYDSITDRDLRVRRSGDLGESFEPAVVVDEVTPVGDSFLVQGFFRAFLDLQGLAVDESGRASAGTLYVSWHDGRNNQQPDPLGGCLGPEDAVYCFGDVLLSRSADGGRTWSDPVRVNDDDPRLGIDQLFPALGVDRSGTVYTAFYDKRRDNRNVLMDVVVAGSRDGGRTWTNTRTTQAPFPAVVGQDGVVNPVYMGDYNAVEPDQLGWSRGVLAVYGENSRGDPNVVAVRQ
jgi:hypothetical protein